MKREDAIQAVKESLEGLNNFKTLSGATIDGINLARIIVDDIIERNTYFLRRTHIITNRQFELVYSFSDMCIQFNTSYSNQTIDEDYMNIITTIFQQKFAIEATIKFLIKVGIKD